MKELCGVEPVNDPSPSIAKTIWACAAPAVRSSAAALALICLGIPGAKLMDRSTAFFERDADFLEAETFEEGYEAVRGLELPEPDAVFAVV